MTETGVGGSAAGFAPVANERQVVAFHFFYQGLIAELTLHPAPRRLAKDGAPDGETFDHRVCGRLGETGAQFVGRRVKPEDQDPAAPRIFTLDKRGDLLPAGAGERRQLPPVRLDPQLIEVFQHGVVMALVFVRAIFRQDHLQQQFMA